jgi:hypothetical protein
MSNMQHQTVIIVNQPSRSNSKNESVQVFSCLVAFFLTPIISLLSLFFVKSKLSRGLIIRMSGFCGLAWAGLFFFLSFLSSLPSSKNEIPYWQYKDDFYDMPFYDPGYNMTSWNTTYPIAIASESAKKPEPMYSSVYEYEESASSPLLVGCLVSLGLFTLISSVVMISVGCIAVRNIKEVTPDLETAITLDQIHLHPGILQQNPRQTIPLSPPPYKKCAMVNEVVSSRSRTMSLESLAMHLDIPKLLNVSFIDAMQMDFQSLKLCCGLSEVEFIRLKRYRTSIQ